MDDETRELVEWLRDKAVTARLASIQTVLGDDDKLRSELAADGFAYDQAAAALTRLAGEVEYMKQREADICKAVGGVSDGGRFRNDIIEVLQIVTEKSDRYDDLCD